MNSAIEQRRRLVTELPGPRSRALQERKVAAVSAGASQNVAGAAAMAIASATSNPQGAAVGFRARLGGRVADAVSR